MLKRYYDPFKADIWSLGVILFAMFTKTHPFNSKKKNFMLENEFAEKYKFSYFRVEPSAEMKNTIQSMLNPTCKSRTDILTVIKHKWIAKDFKKIDNTSYM